MFCDMKCKIAGRTLDVFESGMAAVLMRDATGRTAAAAAGAGTGVGTAPFVGRVAAAGLDAGSAVVVDAAAALFMQVGDFSCSDGYSCKAPTHDFRLTPTTTSLRFTA